MDRRFDTRLSDMLAQAQVPPDLIDGLLSRLETFVLSFTASLREPEQRRHTVEYLTGLLSRLAHKTGEGIAYLLDQQRQGLQKFLGQVPWEDRPLLATLARQVGDDLGEADGVIVFDPSAFAKKGTKSVGVARRWCGRLGKVENCQVGISLAYVSRKEHAIVNMRLYLPEEWTTDRRRCRAAGVPETTTFRTRHELAWEMLDEHGSLLPHAWVAGDDEMGRPTGFRTALSGRGERYLLAVPSNTLVRDSEAPRRNTRDAGGIARVAQGIQQRLDSGAAPHLARDGKTARGSRDGETPGVHLVAWFKAREHSGRWCRAATHYHR